jgi:hypothetical protein
MKTLSITTIVVLALLTKISMGQTIKKDADGVQAIFPKVKKDLLKILPAMPGITG